ncbi:MAG: Holliday junction branch migration protein RuvA [Methylobacteriaceae bacterium]|jgi:Holliday junction DNA helicase RuvA|nr:Holliday junction branch migration protein RuvA [Methylobacteriaceae bacterium]
MIGKLKGLIESIDEDSLILDVGGVGYLVFCSGRTLQALPAVGEAAELHIETQVREDAIRLFGFRSRGERALFNLLQTVQGVGSKVALGLLSIGEPGALVQAIASGDRAALSRAPGVGPKLAQRICAELRDKAPALGVGGGVTLTAAALTGADSALPSEAQDAVSALVNLGYPRPQAAAAVAAALARAGENPEAKTLIRLGLRELAR